MRKAQSVAMLPPSSSALMPASPKLGRVFPQGPTAQGNSGNGAADKGLREYIDALRRYEVRTGVERDGGMGGYQVAGL